MKASRAKANWFPCVVIDSVLTAGSNVLADLDRLSGAGDLGVRVVTAWRLGQPASTGPLVDRLEPKQIPA